MKRDNRTGKCRMPSRTKATLNKLAGISDVRQACEFVVDLVENHYESEYEEANAFDPRTGKAVGFIWRSGERFESSIYLGGANSVDPGEKDIRLHPLVARNLISSPILINCSTGKYAFIYSEHSNSGTEQGGGTFYATRRQINVYKLTEIR